MAFIIGLFWATLSPAAAQSYLPQTLVHDGTIVAAPGWQWVSTSVVLDGMRGTMDQLSSHAGKYAGDLPKKTFSGGLCPTFGDDLWRVAQAPFKACINPSLKKVLGSCSKAVSFDTSKPAETLAAVSSCGRTLAGFGDGNFAANLASAVGKKIAGNAPAQVILNSLTCMTNTLIYAADIPESERKAALAATSSVKTTLLDLVSLSEIAEKIAENGRAAIPDFFKHDISGHDGNKGSVSLVDWAVEANKIGADPLKYGRDRAAGKFKNTTTSLLADAALNSEKTAENLRALAHPEAWRRNSEKLKDECAFNQAEALWELRQLETEKELREARDEMDFYAHRTSCELIKNNFDGLSNPVWRAQMLLHPRTVTNFENWNKKQLAYQNLIEDYRQLRADREAFEERRRDTRKQELGAFFRDVAALEGDSRANARFCNLRDGARPFYSNAELRERLKELGRKATKEFKCSADATKIHLGEAAARIASPQSVWEDFSRNVAGRIASGALCTPSEVTAIRAELDRISLASFGTTDKEVLERCAFPIDMATWVPDLMNAEGAATALKSVITRLAQATAAVDRCDANDADRLITATKNALKDVNCSGHKNYVAVQNALRQLEEKRVVQDMDGRSGQDCREPSGEENLVLITISGGGYIPHWAGGSWKSDGVSKTISKLGVGETTDDRAASVYDQLLARSCKSQLPRGILNYNTPDIWQNLQVRAKRVTEQQAAAIRADSTFKKDDSENPPLSKLRGAACRQRVSR